MNHDASSTSTRAGTAAKQKPPSAASRQTNAQAQAHHAPPPPGGLDGGAMHFISATRRAQLPTSEKNLLLWIIEETYGPDAQARYASGERDWYYVTIDLPTLSSLLGVAPSNLSPQLNRLLAAHLVHRERIGDDGWTRRVALNPEWPAAIFDREGAKEKHARQGAGAPRLLRNPEPAIPLAERMMDIHGRMFLARDAITRDDVWAFVEHFQRSADEAFQPMWLPELERMLDSGVRADLLVATLTNIIGYYTVRQGKRPRGLWGVFRKDVAEKMGQLLASAAAVDAAAATAATSMTEGGHRQHATTTTAPRAGFERAGFGHVTSSSSATGYVARGAERTRRRLLGDAAATDDDDTDAPEIDDADHATRAAGARRRRVIVGS